MQIDITIGWTKSDMDNGYSSFGGYRPGAEQHTETISIQSHGSTGIFAAAPTLEAVEQIADAAFEATNSPFPQSPLAVEINEELERRSFYGEQSGHYSLSTGDTVTVGEVTLECAPMGWKQISLGVQV